MMKMYFMPLFFLCCISQAQIINFPDITFKQTLLYASDVHLIAQNLSGDYFAPDANGDGEIEVSEAEQVKYLNFFTAGAGAGDLTGLEYFINLESMDFTFGAATTIPLATLTHFKSLNAMSSSLSTLDFSNCPNLINLYCPDSQLTSLNLTGVTMLENIDVSGNPLTSLEVHAHSPIGTFGDGSLLLNCGGCPLTSLVVEGSFNEIDCTNDLLTTLDLSNCTYGMSFRTAGNPLVILNLKNGASDYPFGSIGNNSSLQYVCCDEGYESESTYEYLINDGNAGFELNSYCTIPPGGQYFTLQGASHYDSAANGCDISDAVYPHMAFHITNQSAQQSAYSADVTGNYSLWYPAGTYTITPVVENPSYFTVTPPDLAVTFADQTAPVIQDFCVSPNGIHPDLAIALIPVDQARPGFDSSYRIVYRNVGTVAESGSVSLSFDDGVADLVSANPSATSQATGNLSWDFTGLQPFESRTILCTLNLNTPSEAPAVNGGDILHFDASVAMSDSDENAADNVSVLAQTVVNSFDPNDKTCLEGVEVTADMAGKYVNYLIRFENTGTANAENVIVKDVIDDTKFDISTLTPVEGSHPFFTRFYGSRVDFVFDGINLPFDDANNDGYLVFRIKTKPTLVAGDTFSNTASIYFDYNMPIVTNTATTIIASLAVKDFNFEDYFTIWPNPVKDVVNIKSKKQIAISSISIYNTLGQLISTTTGDQKSVDVANLKSGNYFLRIQTSDGVSATPFIKR